MAHRVLDGAYLTRSELAAELGVSERTIWRWDNARVGPPRTTLGRRILYRREGVTKWLKDREVPQVRAGSPTSALPSARSPGRGATSRTRRGDPRAEPVAP
jgi:predicted DNA-binding transcriptional regulator AlpA